MTRSQRWGLMLVLVSLALPIMAAVRGQEPPLWRVWMWFIEFAVGAFLFTRRTDEEGR